MGLFDIKSQLAFYSAYHRNHVNQWIHICCVPLIFWSAMVFFSEVMIGDISASWFIGAAYALFYFMLDPICGSVLGTLCIGGVFLALDFVKDIENAYQIAIGVHVLAWVLQFIGHGVYEGRAPSLFTSFWQSLFMAPFFVFLECLFMLGFKKDLQADVDKMVGDVLLKANAPKKTA